MNLSSCGIDCGKCDGFPCGMLQEWACNENPERIDNLKNV